MKRGFNILLHCVTRDDFSISANIVKKLLGFPIQ